MSCRDALQIVEKLDRGIVRIRGGERKMKAKREQNKVDVVEKGQKIDVAGKGVASLIADARVAQLKAHKTDSGKSEAPKVDKKNVVKHKHEKAAAKAPKFSDEQLIAALKAIGHPATSREVSDALHIADPDYGRSMIRARMDELAKVGKVKMVDAPKDTRFKKLYEVA